MKNFFNSNHIDLSITSTYQYVVANTRNKIDCTSYDNISVYYSMSVDYSTRLMIEKSLSPAIFWKARHV